MAQAFQFIDGLKHDKATRRLARSHAMKGKNAGRKLNRRPRKKLDQEKEKTNLTDDGKIDGDSDHTDEGSTYFPLIDTFRFVTFPVEALPESQFVINHFFNLVVDAIYLPSLCRSLEGIKLDWLHVLFRNRTSYHCTIALMDTLNGFFLGREGQSAKMRYHIGEAITLVNQSLGTPDGLSDTNMMVVNNMAVQGMLHNDKATAEVHLVGLREMIRLRGGLSQIGEDWMAVKVCKTEWDVALHFGSAVTLSLDRMDDVYLSLAAEGMTFAESSSIAASIHERLASPLRMILFDLWNIANLFNDNNKIEASTLQQIVVSSGSQLIRFHPLGEPPLRDRLEAAIHIGLTAFLTTFVIRSGPRRFLQYQLVGECLNKVIRRDLPDEHREVMLWLLFVGGISVLSGPDLGWIAPRISEEAKLLNIATWESVRACFKEASLPWIEALHDEPGITLWQMAQE